MDYADRLSPPVSFLSRQFASKRVLRCARVAFVLALVELLLGGVSLALGVTVDMYIYALSVNAAPLLVPLVLYEGIARKRNGVFLLKLHNAFMLAHFFLVFCADVAMVAYLCTVSIYCSHRDREKCSASGSQQYDCQTSLPGFTNKFEIVCLPLSTQIIEVVSAAGNLAAMGVLAAYLVYAHRLRVQLTQVTTVSRHEDLHEELPEPVVLSVLGIKLSSQTADPDAEIAYPVPEVSQLTLSDIGPNVVNC